MFQFCDAVGHVIVVANEEVRQKLTQFDIMKPPFSYYGGKQKLVSTILPLFPEHVLYNEPFAGGLALLFAKEPSEVEVVNDTNTELINFYRVVQQDFVSLFQEVKITLHSRRLHRDASVVYNNPHLFTPLKRAWAVWVLATQSFASIIDSSFGYDKTKNTATKKVINKGFDFTEEYAVRLQNVQIECADALYIIKSRDHAEAFHYCDPPYFNSDCGHYGGYKESDFKALLELLSSVDGKFLLSSYPSDILQEHVQANGWYQITKSQMVSINAKSGKLKPKTEVLTANYDLNNVARTS
jgi:DNA adenine methylase